MLNFSKMKYSLLLKLKLKRRKSNQGTDDFNWDIYNRHYLGELSEIQNEHTLILEPDDYIFVEDELKIKQKYIAPPPKSSITL